MLLEMNYHLLNSHLINNSMRFYFNNYSDDKSKRELKELKTKMGKVMTSSKILMLDKGKKTIRKYILKWVLKN
jgi:predicted glutamine amidotransferase